MIKLWGRINSTNVKKVLWCLEELHLPYERIDAGMQFGVVNEPAYAELNPNRLVPCLQDGDSVLWESNTIVRYLAARYGQDSLWLPHPAARAQAEKWMDWTTASIAGPYRDVLVNLVRTPPDKRDMKAVANGVDACNRLLAIADVLTQQNLLSLSG